jgi:hypothetical protein
MMATARSLQVHDIWSLTMHSRSAVDGELRCIKRKRRTRWAVGSVEPTFAILYYYQSNCAVEVSCRNNASPSQHHSGALLRLDYPLVAPPASPLWRFPMCCSECILSLANCCSNTNRSRATGIRLHHFHSIQPICCTSFGRWRRTILQVAK